MKVIEYTTELSPDGHFALHIANLNDIDLHEPKTVRILILYEEAPPKKRWCALEAGGRMRAALMKSSLNSMQSVRHT